MRAVSQAFRRNFDPKYLFHQKWLKNGSRTARETAEGCPWDTNCICTNIVEISPSPVSVANTDTDIVTDVEYIGGRVISMGTPSGWGQRMPKRGVGFFVLKKKIW